MLLPVALRKRVVDAYNNREGITVEELSKQFQVAISTIYEWLKLLAETGSLEPRGHRGGWKPRIDEEGLKVLKHIVDQKPDLILKEITEKFNKKTKLDVSMSTIDRALKRLNLTIKKKTFQANVDEEEKKRRTEKFFNEIKDVDVRDMVFIDESGSNLGMARQHARSEKGKRAYSKKPMDRGKNITMLGALSLTGIMGFLTINAATTTDIFLVFIQKVLLPKLRRGHVVIMDNLSSHTHEQIRREIESVGARVVFMPPYSPELNPIEECWSKIKSVLRRCAARTKRAYNKAIKQAINSVSKQDALGWFCHSGYISESK